MSSTGPASTPDDPWYPEPSAYWVNGEDADRPYRYGDLFACPATDVNDVPLLATGNNERKAAGSADPVPWHAVMVLSPSCDVVSKSGSDTVVTVIRVKNLALQSAPQQATVVAGWQERSPGVRTVAFASFAYLAGVPSSPGHTEHMYADFRTSTLVRYNDLAAAGRIAAMDHDARVHLIRREIYYKFRWLVPLGEVRAAEASRILNDDAFAGPKPHWAQSPMLDLAWPVTDVEISPKGDHGEPSASR